MKDLKKLVSWILKGWLISLGLSHSCSTSLSSGRKLWFKHGIPMSQEMTSSHTKLPFSLMGSPEIDVPYRPAAGLCCHLEELLLYQNSHWSLLFQGDNFVIKKWFVILRLGKQAYKVGCGGEFICRGGSNSCWGVLLPHFVLFYRKDQDLAWAKTL